MSAGHRICFTSLHGCFFYGGVFCAFEKAGLSRPVWIAQAYQQQIAESRRPEEETTPRET